MAKLTFSIATLLATILSTVISSASGAQSFTGEIMDAVTSVKTAWFSSVEPRWSTFRSRMVLRDFPSCAGLESTLGLSLEVSLFPRLRQFLRGGSPVTPEQIADNKEYLARAVEASIRIGLVGLLLGACLVILRPSLPLIACGVIVRISVYPESQVTATSRRPG